MVKLEIEDPLLTLRFLPPYAESDERDYLAALRRIGEHPTPFVLLTMFGGGGHMSAAAEREQALWFKTTRAHVSAQCRAMAIVRPNANAKMEETFRKLWSIPLIARTDEAEARTFLASYASAA